MSVWKNLRWLVVLHGASDATIWPFECDEWLLLHGSPAMSMFGLLPHDDGPLARLEDALWIADVLSFDHDAPVGVKPSVEGGEFIYQLRDNSVTAPHLPLSHLTPRPPDEYWLNLNEAYGAAALIRFGGAVALRYNSDYPDPGTNFRERFEGRENLLSLYAMAARQPDVLTEYLCHYRALEAADGGNGTTFIDRSLSRLREYDFGLLRMINDLNHRHDPINVFDAYRTSALIRLAQIEAQEKSSGTARYLYGLRNSIAHGKYRAIAGNYGSALEEVAAALPLVKLLSRLAVETAPTTRVV